MFSSTLQAMNHFGVTEELLRRVLAAALEMGGDYADLYFEHSFNNLVGLMDGQVNNCSSNIDFGVGVRVIAGEQTGYAYVEGVTPEELLRAAHTAARIASSGPIRPVAERIELYRSRDCYLIDQPWEEVELKSKIPFLEKINSRIFALDSRVMKVQATLADTTSHIFFCNSEGVSYYDYRPMGAFSVVCVMQQEGMVENGYAARAFRRGFEMMNDELVETLAHEVVDHTAILFDAVKPKGGEMPVVMGAGGSGILLHEAIGHAFEADFNRKRTSIFCDQLGKKICNERIQVVDDATIPYNRGSIHFDDEGVEGQKTYLVKDGVLASYLHDRISARYYGVQPTGNGRRDTFRNVPLPRMRATYMESGTMDEQEIIASVKQGVYVDNFVNGQVQIGAGDFTFYVKSGYLIENGRLTAPLKDINIIGNGPQALADITLVGNNSMIDNGTWTCGKEGQSCPVTCGMPSVLVSKLTVGGE